LDVQIGLGLGSVFDPLTQSSVSAVSSALNALGVCAFVLAGAHLEYLAMLAESINHFPIGSVPELADPVRAMSAAGHMFRFGLSLAAPVVVALLLTDIAVGVVSRNAPQLNALLLAIPIKLVVGLSLLAMALPWWETAIEPIFHFGTDLLGATR
jgi:flagellar biosynthetic protein FliR